MTLRTLLLGLCVLLCFGCGSPSGGGGHLRSVGPFARAVVAADHELASRAGAEILAAGGNAVDAAVATSLALSVVRPYSCGIGGGGFMIISLVDDERHGSLVTAIDYREVAPAAVGAAYYESGGRSSTRGGTAVAVPGTVAGLMYAQEKYGRLPRSRVVAPAIALAERGFAVDAHYVAAARQLEEQFEKSPQWKDRFGLVWSRFLRDGAVEVGDVIRLPEQAEALRLISRDGAAAFYDGEIGRRVVHAARKDGGDMTLADLRNYRVRETEPVRVRIGDYEFVGMPPPSSGGVTMLQALSILEAAGHPLGFSMHDSAAGHLIAESLKHAFADRARWFGDPAFVDVPVPWLVSRDHAMSLAAKIDLQHTGPPHAYGSTEPGLPDSGTSHFSIVDIWGNAVACTETINLEFGSLVGVDEFGFVLNNEMDDFLTRRGETNAFGLVQSERNLPAPGKRPLSSMSPTLVFDDAGLVAVAGASGGPRIITGTMQVLLRVLAGESAVSAVGAPRLHHQWIPNRVELEAGLMADDEVRLGLEARGHEVIERAAIGDVQVIRRLGKGWDAASDPRKGGRPVGY
ncbi:MAG: gamma-glutamyltransferase [Phycisphaeraceae bacterium]|nr:gamma-glutamyltransferase [Phycisphaeraceae bacterium]MCW5762246.1 gamma-glutamyltransferase [Phycisphaeraceae bacterium]